MDEINISKTQHRHKIQQTNHCHYTTIQITLNENRFLFLSDAFSVLNSSEMNISLVPPGFTDDSVLCSLGVMAYLHQAEHSPDPRMLSVSHRWHIFRILSVQEAWTRQVGVNEM